MDNRKQRGRNNVGRKRRGRGGVWEAEKLEASDGERRAAAVVQRRTSDVTSRSWQPESSAERRRIACRTSR